MTGIAILLGIWGVVVGILWLLIGFRAVSAHEKLADAQKEQTKAISDYVRFTINQEQLKDRANHTK